MRSRFLLANRPAFGVCLAIAPLGVLALPCIEGRAAAATLQVGPGQTYTTPCAAIAAASAGDEIDIAAGTYTDTCAISTQGLHLKGIGGQPKIDITGVEPAQDKGIYAIAADDVIIENLELTGAAIDDSLGGNGAGLRIQSNGVTVTNCYIHDNQDGILSGPLTAGTGTLTIDHTEFKNNGLGDACDAAACVHNVYTGDYAKFIFQFNWTHQLATDTADKGHLLKSRALENDILYNRITGETGHDSYEVDLPNGGLGILIGNIIEKGPNPDNEILLDYGEEGYGTGTNTLYLSNNTFVNDDTTANSPVFVNVASGGSLAAAHDDIFAGPGTVSSTGTLSADNLAGTEASFLFVSASTYDYHLQSGSPAIGKAVPPGMAGTLPLTPVYEYVDPLSSVPRLADDDVGAFEYGTNTSDPSTDAGAESPDGALTGEAPGDGGASSSGASSGSGSGAEAGSGSGSGGASGSGSSGSSGSFGGADAGAAAQGSSGGGGGGCATSGRGDGPLAGLFAIGLAAAAIFQRTRRRGR